MDLVNSLFGLPPQEQLRQQQLSRDVGLGGLFAAATVNPYAAPAVQDAYLKQQQAQFALGSMGARGLGSLFGFKDPELQRVSTLEGILQGVSEEVDINNPVQFYPTLQKRLQEAGFSQEAAQVGMAGQEAIQNFGLTQAKIGAEQQRGFKEQATGEFRLAQAQDIEAQTKIKKDAIPGIKAFIKSRIPDIDDEQAEALAQTPRVAEELLKTPKMRTQLADVNGRVTLVNMDTGEPIADLGTATDKGTRVNVNLGDKTQELITKEIDIPIFKQLSESASASRNLARDSRTIANLLKGTEGGQIVKVTTKLAKDLGLQNESISANDLANALATRGAVNIRAVGSGSTSDLEFKAYLEAFPSIANSPQGRELMAKYAEKFAERQEKLADKARELIRNGQFSQGALNAYDESLGSVLGDDFYKGAAPKVNVRPKTEQLMKKFQQSKGKK
jgi:hypothetical protein